MHAASLTIGNAYALRASKSVHNKHIMCHFLSVFYVNLSQNEPSESQKKYPVDKYTNKSNGIGRG